MLGNIVQLCFLPCRTKHCINFVVCSLHSFFLNSAAQVLCIYSSSVIRAVLTQFQFDTVHPVYHLGPEYRAHPIVCFSRFLVKFPGPCVYSAVVINIMFHFKLKQENVSVITFYNKRVICIRIVIQILVPKANSSLTFLRQDRVFPISEIVLQLVLLKIELTQSLRKGSRIYDRLYICMCVCVCVFNCYSNILYCQFMWNNNSGYQCSFLSVKNVFTNFVHVDCLLLLILFIYVCTQVHAMSVFI